MADNQQVAIREDIRRMQTIIGDKTDDFRKVLAMIDPKIVDKFVMQARLAILKEPKLAECKPQAVLVETMKAAADGLMIDGKEAALVVYNVNVAKAGEPKKWEPRPQYMPMIRGIYKRAHNSREIKSFVAHCVYAKDHFKWVQGDAEEIIHQPSMEDDRGQMTHVYAIVRLVNGGIEREVMSRGQVDRIRLMSKNADGVVWKNNFEEMSRKTVAHRIGKRIPMASDLAQVFEHYEDTFDGDVTGDIPGDPIDVTPAAPQKARGGVAAKRATDTTAQQERAPAPPHDAETGEIIEGSASEADHDPRDDDPAMNGNDIV